jgi:copper chaperone CopZ
MKHMILELENLDCDGCANSIRRVLLRQPGVLSVHVEVSASRVNLSCEDDLDRAHIISVLENLGYPPLGRNSMLSIARARLSCELGKIRHNSYYHPILS